MELNAEHEQPKRKEGRSCLLKKSLCTPLKAATMHYATYRYKASVTGTASCRSEYKAAARGRLGSLSLPQMAH